MGSTIHQVEESSSGDKKVNIKSLTRYEKPLTSFWKQDSAQNDSKIEENRRNNDRSVVERKSSFPFFNSIKKRLRIKNLTYKSKQKMRNIDSVPVTSKQEKINVRQSLDDPVDCMQNTNDLPENDVRLNDTTRKDDVQEEEIESLDGVKRNSESLPIGETISDENEMKASLTEELLQLSRYGWYWGPISGEEADLKLLSEPDGAFLVRDSSDDRYLLTLSFKSCGKCLHTRLEHSLGLFSLCYSESQGFPSVSSLISHSMSSSRTSVFCYSQPRHPGLPAFPVRLTKPVSRFTEVRSLQYLCRFVIRQHMRVDNIGKLPLPETIKDYIEQAHY